MNCDGGAVRPDIDASRRMLTELEFVFSYSEYFIEDEPALTDRITGFGILQVEDPETTIARIVCRFDCELETDGNLG